MSDSDMLLLFWGSFILGFLTARLIGDQPQPPTKPPDTGYGY